MELYNEFKDKALRTIINIYNDCVNKNAAISKKEIYNKLQLKEYKDTAVDEVIKTLFTEVPSNANMLQPLPEYGGVKIPIQPSKIEAMYLKELLNNQIAAIILGDELKAKLEKLLTQENLPDGYWTKKVWQGMLPSASAAFIARGSAEIFVKVLQALEKKNYVYYESYDIYGNSYQGKAAPYKIEYCGSTDNINIIMWNEEKHWTFKSDINTITRLDILPECCSETVIKEADDYVAAMKEKEEPIVLKINAAHTNALERCCNLFAEYDKELSCTAKDIFMLKIFHRDHFDKAEIKQAILSLGSSVMVMQPEKLKKEIIEEIQNSFTR